MAIDKSVKPQTLFDLAQAQMFEQVKRRVTSDIIESHVARFKSILEAELDGYMAEYSALEVMHLIDLSSFNDQFVIYISNDKKSKGEEVYRS